MALLTVQNLSCRFGDTEALRQLNLEVQPGDFLGLLGPNGAGKSTFLRAVSGILPNSGGHVLWKGRPLNEIPRSELARFLAVLPAETFIPYDFTVWDIVLMGRSPHLGWWQDPGERDERIALETLEAVEADHLKGRSIHSLSSGEKQRVLLAQALVQEPEILLLDEPTVHLDVAHQMELFELLQKLNTDKLLTIVMVIHDLSLAAQFCRRLLLLQKGRAAAWGTPEQVLTEDTIAQVYRVQANVSLSPNKRFPQIQLLKKISGGSHDI